MTQETTTPKNTTSGRIPDPRSHSSVANPPDAQAARRVSLDQLLSVVVLSPAQASLLAVRVLDAVRIILTSNGTHPADTHRWTVALGLSGEVDVGRATAGEGALTAELLEQLTDNARRLPAHPRPEQVGLLRLLDEVAADPRPEPGPRARQLEGALAEVLGPGAGQRLSGQLAALIGAFAHIAPSVSVPLTVRPTLEAARPDPRRTSPGPVPLASRRRRRPVVGHRRARTRRAALVLLFLAAALAGSVYAVLRYPAPEGTDASARDDNPTTTAPSGAPGKRADQPRPRPREGVGALAGRQSGQVTGVEVQKVGSCTPGLPCPVTVTVHLRPAATTQSVAWRVGAARLCRSGITWSQPVAMTAQPGWTTVYASSSVVVPPGRSLALVALTTAPARAQSPPVPVTGSSLGC